MASENKFQSNSPFASSTSTLHRFYPGYSSLSYGGLPPYTMSGAASHTLWCLVDSEDNTAGVPAPRTLVNDRGLTVAEEMEMHRL
jgi:hypothetical protein